jgi:hypothetical protein
MHSRPVTTVTEGNRDYRLAYGLLAAVILLWDVNWPVMKIGLTLIPPLWFAAAHMVDGCRNHALCFARHRPVALAAASGPAGVAERRHLTAGGFASPCEYGALIPACEVARASPACRGGACTTVLAIVPTSSLSRTCGTLNPCPYSQPRLSVLPAGARSARPRAVRHQSGPTAPPCLQLCYFTTEEMRGGGLEPDKLLEKPSKIKKPCG